MTGAGAGVIIVSELLETIGAEERFFAFVFFVFFFTLLFAGAGVMELPAVSEVPADEESADPLTGGRAALPVSAGDGTGVETAGREPAWPMAGLASATRRYGLTGWRLTLEMKELLNPDCFSWLWTSGCRYSCAPAGRASRDAARANIAVFLLMPRSLLSGSPDTLSHLGLIGTMHEFLNDIFSGR